MKESVMVKNELSVCHRNGVDRDFPLCLHFLTMQFVLYGRSTAPGHGINPFDLMFHTDNRNFVIRYNMLLTS